MTPFIILAVLALIITFYLLAVICDEYFVDSLDRISDKLKLSSDVAGATFMAVGSSAPELFTSFISVLKPGNHADIGSGTIVGSAIFNILVIIGASALFKRAKLNWQPVVRDTLFYSLSIVLLLLSFWDGKIVISESVLFISLYIGYIIAVINWRKFFPYKDQKNPIDVFEKGGQKSKLAIFSKKLLSCVIPDCNKQPKKYLLTFTISILLIGVLSYILVESAVFIGEAIHISPIIIALTVLAAGTSIPDLLSSIVVAKQGRGDMAISNAVGSNIFDILIGLGLPWMIILAFKGGSITVANENLLGSVFLLFATVLAVFFLLLVRRWTIGRKAGLLLIIFYLTYLGWNILEAIR
jgi:K+-dependent Na+/Ca+ exchanger-like protein